jgi:hypothetical protein
MELHMLTSLLNVRRSSLGQPRTIGPCGEGMRAGWGAGQEFAASFYRVADGVTAQKSARVGVVCGIIFSQLWELDESTLRGRSVSELKHLILDLTRRCSYEIAAACW